MKKLTKNKSTMLAILIFLIVIFLYRTFFQADIVTDVDVDARDIGGDLLETLSRLESISFDQEILSSPAYRSLIDAGVVVPEQPVGRANPFAPFGQN